MNAFAIIAIGQMIQKMPVDKKIKTRISYCTLYNQRKSERVDLYKKLESCKKRIIKGRFRKVLNVREGVKVALPIFN